MEGWRKIDRKRIQTERKFKIQVSEWKDGKTITSPKPTNKL